MSALTGVSATGAVGSVGRSISIALTGVSASTTTGQIRAFETPGQTLQLRLPMPQLALEGVVGTVGDLTLDFRPPTLALVGDVPVTGTLTIALPTPQVAMTGLVGSVGTLVLTLPTPRLQLAEGDTLVMRVPTPQLALVGLTGVVGDLYLKPRAPSLVLTGDVPVIGTLSLALPVPQFALDGDAGSIGRLGILLRSMTLAMEGVTGVLGTLTLPVPMVRFTASGYWEAVGVLNVTLPAMHLALTGGAPQSRTAGGSAPVGNANTLVMHTERMALSQYTNFPFNSMARFAGVYIGASDAGVFSFAGDTDDGAIIQASARSGITDFGTSHIKRVDRMYVGYRSNGPLVLRVITDEGAARDYSVPAPTPAMAQKIRGNHVRMGRGVDARYWQFEFRNANGADFTIDILEMKPTKLRRRIGGNDA